MPVSNESRVLVGLEIHQQLATGTKLFCSCPPAKSEEFPYTFERRLRPAQSELGMVDPAAVFEFSKGKSNVYSWNPESSCLVEADEEPPHPPSEEALKSTFLVGLALGSNPVDEVHVMRKIVIDGSNTGGFQRTAVACLGGSFKVDGVEVGVQSVTVEEDAARILGEDGAARHFALDRLGVPLVEIALDPVEGSPEFVYKVALHLGRVLRSTRRVARGLGTIRQDLNISVGGGRVVEVKGVQKLNTISKVVEYETRRQEGLREVAEKLREKGVGKVKCSHRDVTRSMGGTSSGIIRKQLEQDGIVVCITAPGLKGLIGWEPYPGVRLGREVADVARANSLGGVIHSDEFARQGITEEEEDNLRRETGAAGWDALILVAGRRPIVEKAARVIVERLNFCPCGVPAETRAATDEGETRYMRPRPGSERMYPETDVRDLRITTMYLEELTRELPESWEKKVSRLSANYALSPDLALKIFDSDDAESFESLSHRLNIEPSLIASTLVELPARLSREGVQEEALTLQAISEALQEVDSGAIAKEAIPEVLRLVGSGKARDVRRAIESLGLRAADEFEVGEVVDAIIKSKGQLIAAQGGRAFSALMGEAMAQLRGKADGETVSRILRAKLAEAVRDQGHH